MTIHREKIFAEKSFFFYTIRNLHIDSFICENKRLKAQTYFQNKQFYITMTFHIKALHEEKNRRRGTKYIHAKK